MGGGGLAPSLLVESPLRGVSRPDALRSTGLHTAPSDEGGSRYAPCGRYSISMFLRCSVRGGQRRRRSCRSSSPGGAYRAARRLRVSVVRERTRRAPSHAGRVAPQGRIETHRLHQGGSADSRSDAGGSTGERHPQTCWSSSPAGAYRDPPPHGRRSLPRPALAPKAPPPLDTPAPRATRSAWLFPYLLGDHS